MTRNPARSGQVTIFVLVGLALLLGLLLFLFLTRERPFLPETLPAEFTPVQDHVHQCLRSTALDGLKLLAMHGGYLDPLDAEETGEPLRLDLFEPTESDLVRLNPADAGSAIPYYYYLASPNNCQECLLTTLAPSQAQMEERLRQYVLAHLSECLNFGQFPEIDVRADPEQSLVVMFTEESVLLEYGRRLVMTQEETTETAARFPERIDLPFLRYYRVAMQVTQREIDTQFLENWLLYLVTAYSGIDAPLPPLGGYDEGFAPSFWILLPVQQEYWQLVTSFTPSLQVLGTKGVEPPPVTGDPYVDGFLALAYLDLINDSGLKVEDLRISIMPHGPLYLDVNPRSGQLITPRSERQSGILFIPPRQQNYYDFYYDVSAPFIVEIRHDDALPGTEISFLFALEANIRENKNMAQWLLGRGTIPWSRDFVRYEVTDPASALPPNETYPNLTETPRYQRNASLTSLFCDASQRTVPLELKVVDARTQRALEGVTFSYACGYHASCAVGESLLDEHAIYADLETRVPPCLGGLLKAEKEGYNTVTLKVSTRNGQPQRLPALSVEPFVPVNVTFERRQVRKEPLTGALSLEPAEPVNASRATVFATLIRQPQMEGEAPVMATALLSNDTIISELALIPGLYEVKAMYLDNEGFTIRKGCKMIAGTPVPENDTEIKPAPWGGLELTRETGYWLLERNALYSGKSLIIPVFVAPPPVCIDDLEAMGETLRYSRTFPDEAQPRFE